ncbi:MAG: cytochrome P450 [Porticoccaceae bacterium]
MTSIIQPAASNMASDFAAVSDVFSGAGEDNPYPMMARLRDSTPVMEGDILAHFGVPSQADYANKGRQVFTTFRYEDCMAILRDPETFTSSLLMDGLGAFLEDAMLTALDGEAHRNLRASLQGAFTPANVKHWHENMIGPVIVDEFVKPLVARKRCDLVNDFALHFPVRVIYELMGFPNDPAAIEQFAGWALRILAGPQPDPEKAKISMAAAFQAAQDLYDHVRPIVAARRASGDFDGRDLMSHLLRADAQGAQLDDHKITNIIRMLLPAAAETTTRSFANMMVLLLDRPELLARVWDDRKLVPKVINESLRYEPVSAFLARQAAKDVEIAGVKIPKGAAISLANGCANRDESAFANGETFDIDRPLKPILSFGFGAHTCLGLAIAKMEMTSALNAVLDHMPGLRYDPAEPRAKIVGITMRGPRAVHVVHD